MVNNNDVKAVQFNHVMVVLFLKKNNAYYPQQNTALSLEIMDAGYTSCAGDVIGYGVHFAR